MTPIYRMYPNSTLLNTLAVNFYGEWPTLPQRCGRSCLCRKANGNKKVESKVEGLVGLGIFVASALSLLYVLRFQIVLQPLPRGTLPIFEMILPFHLPILLPLRHRASQTSVKLWPPEEAWLFQRSDLVPSLILVWIWNQVALPPYIVG